MTTEKALDHPSPARRQPRGEARRRAMLDAAISVFLEHGYEGASLDLVIERSGGSRRTLYEHFGNKEGLFRAAIETLFDRILVRLSSLDLETGDPEDALTEAGREFLTALTAPDMLAGFRTVLGEATRFPVLGETLLRQGPERAYARVAAWLAHQTEKGALTVAEPDLAARQFIEMVKGDVHLRALLRPADPPTEAEIDRHVREAVRTFLYGVAATHR